MGASSTLSPGPSERLKIKGPALLWVALMAVPVLAVIAFAVFQPVKVRPRMGLAPGYAFTNQAGRQVTSEDLRGKFVLYNFTYADCQAPCPDMMTTMREAQALARRMDLAGVPFELVTMTVNPAQDSPERWSRFIAEQGLDTSNWQFLTGPADRLKNVIGGGFRVFYEPDGQGGVKFDPNYILVDGNGIVRAVYETAAPNLDILERDIGLVVNEVKSSSGPGRLVYEAAHLFLCYPRQ